MRSKIAALLSVITVASVSILQADLGSRYVPGEVFPSTVHFEKKGWFSVAGEYGYAESARNKDGEKIGVGELFGTFNLKDFTASLREAYGTVMDPFRNFPGYETWSWMDAPYFVDGEIKVRAIRLSTGYAFGKKRRFFVYGNLPISEKVGNLKFTLNKNGGDPRLRVITLQEEIMMDYARRIGFETVWLENGEYRAISFGAFDAGVGYRTNLNLDKIARETEVTLRVGMLLPLTEERDWDDPASFTRGTNGFYGIYGDVTPYLTLKSGIEFGGIFNLTYLLPRTHTRRIAHLREPDTYSALKGKVEDSPGLTMRTGAEVIFNELGGGIGARAAYMYMKHWEDDVKDKREFDGETSYLTDTTTSDINSIRSSKKELSKWSSHYVMLGLEYDSDRAGKSWKFKPVLFGMVDLPIANYETVKLYKVSVGARMRID